MSAENVFGASDPCELSHSVTTHKEVDRDRELEMTEAKKRRQKLLDGMYQESCLCLKIYHVCI